LHVKKKVILQPDLQWIGNRSSNRRHSAVGGIRLMMEL
jgi:hypothetical protein